MIHFFGDAHHVFAVQATSDFQESDLQKLTWLFGNRPRIQGPVIDGIFIGPRAAMVSPWSTNAVEITQNMGLTGITRIEQYESVTDELQDFDPMLSQKFRSLKQDLFSIDIQPEPIKEIKDIAGFNNSEGLALSEEEIEYLEKLAQRLGRPLTDSEVFGFSQVNSEHCRHKIFNGTFVIDGEAQESSLFKMIKKTSEIHPNTIVSAYKDNVAFIEGPTVTQFAPERPEAPSYYQQEDFESVIALKAETHNFPTTVEPFNGAATGSGGEIRDRLAGGQGSLPLAGTAVYMTAYSRLNETRPWEQEIDARDWLYQTPLDILIKASNGASDFGNKFGQPLIAGSVLTFEHEEDARILGFDKVIMLAGGIGYGKKSQAIKATPSKDDEIVILGGENYRIGMGGAAVSSADTGALSSGIELNAIQRSNPEMQKRAANAIRGMIESKNNPIVSIHDHGAGGHLNCLSELVEETGGHIDLDALPAGDPTLSAKELIGNESQERMGLVIGSEEAKILKQVADRERAPMYKVGQVTDDHRFKFEGSTSGQKPMDFMLSDMFGSSPKTLMEDRRIAQNFNAISYDPSALKQYVFEVMRLEAVACKDWLTNKVDRCVSGRVAKQQCTGPLQLPLNNCGVMALDYKGKQGVATAIGHSPISGLLNPAAGSRNSITESLTNILWAPIKEGLRGVSLSANWMWPCNNPGEDARLYEAVKAVSDFAIELGINIPTGKDSLSMKQKYKDREVLSPGTVIISAAGHCDDITKVVEPVLQKHAGSIYYIDFSKTAASLGGSSFAQTRSKLGLTPADVADAAYVKTAFNTLQDLIRANQIAAGHDIGSGGLITTLAEMCFADQHLGADLDLSLLNASDFARALFAENCGVVVQAVDNETLENALNTAGITFMKLGVVRAVAKLDVKFRAESLSFDIDRLRDAWYETSFLLDCQQSGSENAKARYENYKNQPLNFKFPTAFTGVLPQIDPAKPRIKAAIIREKGSNSEREMANAMFLAGFDVKDVHMTDLISGRETLEDIRFIGAVGGFSNSDVLGSAKGWAGAFLYNEKAKTALDKFLARKDTLSLGVCNGCQLFVELGVIHPDHDEKPQMLHNDTGKFECSFTSVTIQENPSVMLGNLAGSTLGIWAAHGEGKFALPKEEAAYNIVAKYGYDGLPANPNGSDYNTAMMCDNSGRHLVMMPHLERSTFPWNWGHYPADRDDVVTPWLQAFVNARQWLEQNIGG